jgi:hypothetical protein
LRIRPVAPAGPASEVPLVVPRLSPKPAAVYQALRNTLAAVAPSAKKRLLDVFEEELKIKAIVGRQGEDLYWVLWKKKAGRSWISVEDQRITARLIREFAERKKAVVTRPDRTVIEVIARHDRRATTAAQKKAEPDVKERGRYNLPSQAQLERGVSDAFMLGYFGNVELAIASRAHLAIHKYNTERRKADRLLAEADTMHNLAVVFVNRGEELNCESRQANAIATQAGTEAIALAACVADKALYKLQ